MLAEPAPEGAEQLDLFDRLLAAAPTSSLTGVLRRATDADDRRMLCDLLGFRKAKAAVPALLEVLADPVPAVRGAAVDVLGKAFGYVAEPRAASRRWRHSWRDGGWRSLPESGAPSRRPLDCWAIRPFGRYSSRP